MNTIGLLLVLGLAFFAMKQKSEKTRNMLLVVSALLGFCMFSAEGFTDITFNGGDGAASTGTGTADTAARWAAGGTVTTADQAVYTFSPAFDPASPETLTDWTCPAGKVKAPLSATELTDAAAAAATLTLDNINSVYPCNDNTEPTPDQSVTGDEADPCKCLTATEGNNLYCNSGWMNPEILEYMGDDGETAPDYASAATCWEGSLDFIPTLGGMFTGRCTRKKGSTTSCTV